MINAEMTQIVSALREKLVGEIAERQNVLTSLDKVFGANPPPLAEPVAVRVKRKKKLDPVIRPVGWSEPKGRRSSARLVECCRTIKEPFNVDGVSQATGTSRKAVSSLLNRWKVRGWVVSAGFGIYQRTPKFGGVTSESNRILKEVHREIETEEK